MKFGIKSMEFYENLDQMMDLSRIKNLIQNNIQANIKMEEITKELQDQLQKLTTFGQQEPLLSRFKLDMQMKPEIQQLNRIIISPTNSFKSLKVISFDYGERDVESDSYPQKKLLIKLSSLKTKGKNYFFENFVFRKFRMLRAVFNQHAEICIFAFHPFFKNHYLSIKQVSKMAKECFKLTDPRTYELQSYPPK